MEDNNDEIDPKKKKVIKPKSDPTQDMIKKLLKDALALDKKKQIKERDLEIDALVSTMEEFLKTFIVIGYDLSNRPVTIMQSKNQLDADALMTSLTRVFIDANNSRNNGGGF